MLNDLLFGLWFFLPAGLANAAPVFAAKVPALDFLNNPIDHGKTFRGKRIFGDHKTYRGFVAGILVGVLTALIQWWLYSNSTWLEANIDVSSKLSFSLAAGFLLALGALVGDSVKSFFKRQIGVPSGASWAPFDQIDYVIGGLVLVSLLEVLGFGQYLSVAFVWVVIHPVSTFIGWLLKIRESPI